ncbi:MAG: hypothetical protein U9N19_01350 [Thermodesulfobacteriota bacterium]|nr:hypothetical protein [Thermodesulfobacteriota bacterium]
MLKKRSRMLGITEAEVIRRAIDTTVVLMHSGLRDQETWEREKAFIAERMAGGPASGGRKFRREDAYEERLRLIELAREAKADIHFILCTCPEQEIKKRLTQRARIETQVQTGGGRSI